MASPFEGSCIICGVPARNNVECDACIAKFALARARRQEEDDAWVEERLRERQVHELLSFAEGVLRLIKE